MILNPGDTLLNGQYRILRQLGRGGYGIVHLAKNMLLDEEVAVKELILTMSSDKEMLKRFLAEAKATMRLTNKRIVRTHNVFSEGGNYYIVMEYMAGGSLEERLEKQAHLSISPALRIVTEVCDGLSYAHQEGVVHCDLKPANILFDAKGSAKVCDFGIAHVSEQMLSRTWQTTPGFVVGTLPYMSPEQINGVRDDPRVDIYAVGAVLYHALTGRTYLDFDLRDTPGALADDVLRIRNELPLPPSAYNPAILTQLDKVVLRALSKRPELRYASADELRAALVQAGRARAPVQAKGTPARSPGQPVRVGAPSRTNQFGRNGRLVVGLVVVLLVAAFLVLCTCGVYAFLLNQSNPGGTHIVPPTQVAYQAKTVYPTRTPATVIMATPANTRPRATTPAPRPTISQAATPWPTPAATLTTNSAPAPSQAQATAEHPVAPAGDAAAAQMQFSAPVLLAPQDGQAFTFRDSVLLQWKPVGRLPADAYYAVTLAYTHLGETWYDEIPWLRETQWMMSDHVYLQDLSDDGLFRWSVQVMSKRGQNAQGKPTGTALSPMSAERTLIWRKSGPSDGGPNH